jgi:N-acyl-phosphatidylethanolamine-hydrolysing phospholipase D
MNKFTGKIIVSNRIAAARIILILIFSFLLSGCWFVKVGIRNMDDAVFGEPMRVQNKIKDPINDNFRFSALWVGHSTTLIQIDDKVIIFDPVFEDVIGGVMLRKIEAGLNIEDIQRLDLVLISHAHMDHMSIPTLSKISDRFKNTSVVIPEGVEKYMPSYDFNLVRMRTGNSSERNYIGETKVINGIKVTTVFANHYGGRYGMDSYTWNVPGCTGYIIEYNGKTVFFAGDTMYDDKAYMTIGSKYKIDLALIPIGPCRECGDKVENGSINHVSPYGALMMLDDLRSDYMIPVHWGSIRYFNDPDTPVYSLKDFINEYSSTSVSGVAMEKPYSEKVKILTQGEQIIFQYK